MSLTCQVHGDACANEVVRTLGPDAYSTVTTCWDGYSILCDREREEARARREEADLWLALAQDA
jgi:hypothetical protein